MRLAQMTWPQAGEYFKENDIILLSVGSIECHGKHLPLGTDTLIPEKLLDMHAPLFRSRSFSSSFSHISSSPSYTKPTNG